MSRITSRFHEKDLVMSPTTPPTITTLDPNAAASMHRPAPAPRLLATLAAVMALASGSPALGQQGVLDTRYPSGVLRTIMLDGGTLDLFDDRSAAAHTLTFTPRIISSSFTAANSVLIGIHPPR
jgi:hypothetical protein